jgi:hypothetical protein
VDSPTSAAVKGISIFRNGSQGDPATATLAYNMTSGNKQGALVNLGTSGKAWRLTANQKVFFGQSGQAHVASGGGVIASDGDNITIAQLGVACDPAVLSLSTNTLVGQVAYLFGEPTGTTYTLTYNFRVNAAGTGLTVTEFHATRNTGGALFQTLGDIPADKFSMLTTVWCGKQSDTDPNQRWGTIPKTGYGSMTPGHEGWKYNTTPKFPTAGISNEGSADGCLYPVGKGWLNGQKLTSSTLGTAVYSFLEKKPAGTTTGTVPLTDNPWVIAGKYAKTANDVLTWKISVPNTAGATLVIDDVYFENTIRNYTSTAAEFKAADYRLHEFDQSKRYRPNGSTLYANPQYLVAGLPVELSIFELR